MEWWPVLSAPHCTRSRSRGFGEKKSTVGRRLGVASWFGSSKFSCVDVAKWNDAGPTWLSLFVTSFSVAKPATLGAVFLGGYGSCELWGPEFCSLPRCASGFWGHLLHRWCMELHIERFRIAPSRPFRLCLLPNPLPLHLPPLPFPLTYDDCISVPEMSRNAFWTCPLSLPFLLNTLLKERTGFPV